MVHYQEALLCIFVYKLYVSYVNFLWISSITVNVFHRVAFNRMHAVALMVRNVNATSIHPIVSCGAQMVSISLSNTSSSWSWSWSWSWQRCKKRQAWQACLCYFFTQTVLILGLLTRSSCATANFLNINMHNLCNCAICGLCICTACPDSTVSASAIDTDGTRTLSQTQNAWSNFFESLK